LEGVVQLGVQGLGALKRLEREQKRQKPVGREEEGVRNGRSLAQIPARRLWLSGVIRE
jgi:hypothetical protein